MDTSSFFNGKFGKINPGMCRLTMNGGIAVKCGNGYKTYNLKKKRLTNVSNFCFDIGSDFFFVIPTMHASVGDIILVNDKPKCVIKVDDSVITVIDYESSEIKQIVPERHVFMGSTYIYGKIVSMFGGSLKGGKGLGKMMKMMMISQMLGGNNSSNASNPITGMFGGGNSNGFGQMMAMSMFMGGKNDLFSGMFDDMSFDSIGAEDSDDDDDDDSVDTED